MTTRPPLGKPHGLDLRPSQIFRNYRSITTDLQQSQMGCVVCARRAHTTQRVSAIEILKTDLGLLYNYRSISLGRCHRSAIHSKLKTPMSLQGNGRRATIAGTAIEAQTIVIGEIVLCAMAEDAIVIQINLILVSPLCSSLF
ncbi:hypothetical protein PROH_14025 [Prochlorothrix hollandica PCC 9006 = CALU 1027]|uniref:Uncharacterized protein n=1 Tax=Prochlorothrix hollandica PCC 9006 = CALU 1027 TaxID=317619 RepID=A0A0M2PS33_PROHO|nr:hypothetical protein PROH_14025 [Prochlorothrix hollandica PCC 9006 = CALU 1027]